MTGACFTRSLLVEQRSDENSETPIIMSMGFMALKNVQRMGANLLFMGQNRSVLLIEKGYLHSSVWQLRLATDLEAHNDPVS
jgi:hypothetical protein